MWLTINMATSYRMKVLQHMLLLSFVFMLLITNIRGGNKDDNEVKEKFKKKNIADYTDVDLERLYDQWEEADEDKLEEDELPEWKRESKGINMADLDGASPEEMLQASKKGRTLMMFATVAGDPTEKETEAISQIWQTDLFNANYEIQRYVVGSNRVLFQLKDGSKAWAIKDYLVQQENCQLVTIDNQDFPGRAAKKEETTTKKKSKKSKSDGDKKRKSGSDKQKKVEL